MSKRVAKAGAAVLAGVMALGCAVQAQAQSPPPEGSYTAQSPNGYYYDPCKREQTQRGTVGAVLGGAAGAVIGSNAAARNTRTEGALLGGLLGAIAGGVVGNKSAACTSQPYAAPPPPPPRADSTYYGPDYYAQQGAYHPRWRDDDEDWAYGPRGQRYRVVEERAPDPDGCTLAESPIYMPDGRTEMRYVRVCRDPSGRYAVVD